jgi:hypothetical protein
MLSPRELIVGSRRKRNRISRGLRTGGVEVERGGSGARGREILVRAGARAPIACSEASLASAPRSRARKLTASSGSASQPVRSS